MATGFFMSATDIIFVQPFLDYLKFQKRYSQHTISAYETDLQDFLQFLQTHFDTLRPSEASTVMIRSWLASLKENGISPRSINRKISSLRSFINMSCGEKIFP